MKNANVLKKYKLFQLNECDAIKEFLEDMALKGWKLKYIKLFYYFEKIEPQALYYSVEVFSKASIYDTIPTKDTNEYIDYCNQAGWEYVCNSGLINIFVSDSKDTIPIETDEQLKFKTIKRGILKQHALDWFFMLPLFLYSIVLDFLSFEYLVTMNMSLMGFLFYLILIVHTIIEIVSFIVWTIKQSRKLKQDEPIQYISKRKRTLFHLNLLEIPLFILLFVGIYSFIQKDFFLAIEIGIIFLFGVAILLLSYFLVERKLSRTANKVIPVFVGLGICIALVISMAILLSSPIADTSSDGAISSSKTFLASSETYDYILEDGSELFVTVFKSNYEFIMNQYLYSKKHHFFEKDYDEIDLPEWNATSTFVSDDRYYVEYDDCIISFDAKEQITSSDIKQIKSFIK